MGETTTNAAEAQALDLCAEIDNLRAAIDDLQLQLRRHIAERDAAISDIEAACKANVSHGGEVFRVGLFVEEKTRAIHFIRQELAKAEVKEGRLYTAGRQLVKRMLDEAKFANNHSRNF